MRKWFWLSGSVLTVALAVFLGQSLLFGTGGKDGKDDKKDGKKDVEKIAKSQITKVTVYPNSALVTRDVDVPAGEGVTEVVVSPLPIRTIDSSLYSEGTDGLRVLSTRFRTRQVQEDTREEVRKLKDEIKKGAQETQKIQSEVQSIEQNMQMLTKMESFTSVTTVSATKEGTLKGEEVITLVKFVMEQRAEKAKKVVELQQLLKDQQEHNDFLQRKLQEITSGSSKEERDAIIVVDRVKGMGGTVRLNYLVDSVSWRPQYKLRSGTKKDEAVEIDYLAALLQQTGEDWNNVNLTLSTAQPTLNAAPPDLKTLDVTVVARSDVGMPPFVPGKDGESKGPSPFAQAPGANFDKAQNYRNQAVEFSNKKDIGNTFKALNDAAALEQQEELMQTKEQLRDALKKLTVAVAGNEGPSVTYHLPLKLSIPSRNDEQVVEITKLSLTPDYYYKTVPILNKNVYRLAKLVNKSEYVLLPGESTMYQGTDFVGRMRMPLVAIGEELTVGFGVDPQLQVQHVMVDKTKSTQGGNQVLTYDYRILVSSYKKEAVTVQVWDRLPHAENETIGVTLLKTSPEVSEDAIYLREQRPQNLLRWDLKVESGMSGEKAVAINYTFKMELAREMVINELKSR